MASRDSNRGSTLKAGKKLLMGEFLKSSNGYYYAKMQSDGNFVLYLNGAPLWQSGTYLTGSPPYQMVVQTYGNLVLYDAETKPTWHSNTYLNHMSDGHHLDMQDDGNLVLYDGNNAPSWNTGTHR